MATLIKCIDCGRKDYNASKGRCSSCYATHKRHRNLKTKRQLEENRKLAIAGKSGDIILIR